MLLHRPCFFDRLTSRSVGEKLYSVDKMINEVSDSARQIHRYIRLTNLVPELLDMVDNSVLKEKDKMPQGGSVLAQLYQAQAEANASKATSRAGKVKALKANAALFNFLQQNGITSMQELYEKVSALNSDYYDLRGQIVKAERRLAALDKRLEMWAQYEKYKPIRQRLDKVKPGKREQYQQEHRAELVSFDAASGFLKSLQESGEAITPKAWKAEAVKLTVQKDMDYAKMRDMRDEIKAVENLRKAADRLAREGQRQQKKQER